MGALLCTLAKEIGFLDTPRVIGEVKQVRPDDENPLLWEITVEPVYQLGGLKQVAIIVMNVTEQP